MEAMLKTVSKIMKPFRRIGADDSRSYCNNMEENQNKARDKDMLRDIQFVTGEGSEKKVFNVDKLLLASRSPVFEKMFYGELAEKRSVIETDDDPEAFKMLLDHIYGKRIKLTSMISAWKYFTVCDKYLVNGIQDTIKKYIEDNFWDIIHERDIYSSQFFLDIGHSYIMENTRKIITSEKFLCVPEDIVLSILQMDKLSVPEYDLLFAITKWVYENIDQVNSKDLIKFYKHIRFSTIARTGFFHFIISYPEVIDDQSSREILQHLKDDYNYNLPTWCTTSKVSRLNLFLETLSFDAYISSSS